jgi:hypothetical protein
MEVGLKLGRRGFIGQTLAVAAGAGVGLGLAQTRRPTERGARFTFGHGRELVVSDDTRAFPDCPVTVEVALPAAVEGARGQAWLHIRTPREHLTRDLGTCSFERGLARIETSLVYPYEDRVAGAYSYHVEVACAGERIVTAEPATFSVRKIFWFS